MNGNGMKNIKNSILLDFYGDLLTEKQYEAVNLHCNEDYSLAEISEQTGITRQGVLESIKKGVDNLAYFEEKLKLHEKSVKRDEILSKISDMTDEESIKELLNEIRGVN